MVQSGYRASHAYSVWVLQHTENPQEDIDLIYDSLADGGSFLVVNLIHRSVPTKETWRDDGIDLRQMLESRFNNVEYLSAPDGAIPDVAQPNTFCSLYRKIAQGPS
jgi:hypothetical protein